MFEFYKRQIIDFNRSISELEKIIEDLAFCDDISNDEYCKLYDLAINKCKKIMEV